MSDSERAATIQDGVRPTWRAYLDDLVPFRPDLHRYCRRLTGNVWDGEDLVQDALLRVFGLMGKVDAALGDPRAYLIRTATNLWIDQLRRRDVHETAREELRMSEPTLAGERSLEVRDAASELLDRLAPRERAAVLLKDVFDLSLEETALTLRTSVGAVKAALHRGRGRLIEIDEEVLGSAPRISKDLLDRWRNLSRRGTGRRMGWGTFEQALDRNEMGLDALLQIRRGPIRLGGVGPDSVATGVEPERVVASYRLQEIVGAALF